MDILILGGTALLGRAIAEAALRSGHTVTCAARGTAPAPEGTSFVTVDRDAPATIIRSGLISGPGDTSGRSGYYPWRFAHTTGADVLVPDDPTFPCALIHVDDLAEWTVHAATHRLDGTFNATGPTVALGDVLTTAARVAHSDVAARPVPAAVLAAQGISAWMGSPSLPLWIDDPEWRFFATADSSAAIRAGLRTRPLEDTLADALAFENLRTGPRPAGLSDDEERALRAALAAS